jgi:hypothetical protein
MTVVLFGPKGELLTLGERRQIARCTVPGCDLVFYEGEERAYERHVGACARANMDRIRSTIDAKHLDVFDDWDPEVSAYMRHTVAPRMLKEGRLEVLPRERTGTV